MTITAKRTEKTNSINKAINKKQLQDNIFDVQVQIEKAEQLCYVLKGYVLETGFFEQNQTNTLSAYLSVLEDLILNAGQELDNIQQKRLED